MEMVTTEGRLWDSSLITGTQWTPDYNELVIDFASGASYKYGEIPEEEYNAFCEAESQGSYFNKNIKGKYPFTKVEKTEQIDEHGDSESI